MPSYMTHFVFILVASNISPALSAPIRKVREQRLSQRQNPGAEVAVAAGKQVEKSWRPTFKKVATDFALGAGATMAFSYAFEKMNSKKGSSTPPAQGGSSTPETATAANTANTANNQNNQLYSSYPPSSYSPSTNPSYPPSTNPSYSPSTNPSSSSPTLSGPTYWPSSDLSNSAPQTQSGYQQRAVDRDLPADIFEARPTSHNNDQNRRREMRLLTRNRRQTASLELSGRADLVEAIRLFSRTLDELD